MGRKKRTPGPGELVQGTLDMLLLKLLSLEEMHGWGIAQRIRQVSGEILRVEEGSLYPALRRLELDGLIRAEWGTSDNNRKARYYQLTPAGVVDWLVSGTTGENWLPRSRALWRCHAESPSTVAGPETSSP
jgi:PadR family transcriptional regulator, regulatory protein PadR